MAQLLDVLHRLRDEGNTIVVIEHNLDVIKTADWVIDLGPEGGEGGGTIVGAGTPYQLAENPKLLHRPVPEAPAARQTVSAAPAFESLQFASSQPPGDQGFRRELRRLEPGLRIADANCSHLYSDSMDAIAAPAGVSLAPVSTSLSALSPGTVAAVVRRGPAVAAAFTPTERRLIELGFVSGERVEVLAQAMPGGDPFVVRVGTTTFALRRREVETVWVEVNPPNTPP